MMVLSLQSVLELCMCGILTREVGVQFAWTKFLVALWHRQDNMTKKIYLVETVSTHKLTYAISTDRNLDDPAIKGMLENHLNRNQTTELRQKWYGEHIEWISEPMDVQQLCEQ